jgi:hypothetical protein
MSNKPKPLTKGRSTSGNGRQMIERELPTKTIRALWRMAGDEGITTINELSERLLKERLERLERERLEREHSRLKRERPKGKIVIAERLLDERLERERLERLEREHRRFLERERSKGKIVNAVCWDGEIHLVALSKETWRVLWREAGDKSCTIDELIESWVEEWCTPRVKELED